MSAHSITLRSDNPPMVVEFELPPGSHARIGSAEDAEIRLPLAGMAAHACRLGRLADGRIYLADPSGGNQRFIGLPAAIPLPPYQFVAFQPEAEAAPAVTPAAVRSSTPRPRERERTGMPLSTVITAAASLVVGLAAAGVLVYLQRAEPSKFTLVSAERGDGFGALPQTFPSEVGKEPGAPEPEAFPSDPEIEFFLEHHGLARVMIVTYDEKGKDIAANNAAVISSDGFVATSMDITKTGVKATIFTGEGKWHTTTRPAITDPDSNVALFKFDVHGLEYFELGDSSTMDTNSPGLIMDVPGRLSSDVWQRRMEERWVGSSNAAGSLPNGGVYLSFPIGRSPSGFGSPVLDRNLRLVGLVGYIPLGMRSPSSDQCMPVEVVRELLKRYHKSPPEPVALQDLGKKADEAFLADPDAKVFYELADTKQWAKAMNLGADLTRKYPQSPELHVGLGNLMASTGDGVEAERILRGGLAISPDHPRLCIQLGNALEMQGKFEDSRVWWTKAAAHESTRPNAWCLLSLSHLQYGNARDAIQPLEQLRKCDRATFGRLIGYLQAKRNRGPGETAVLSHFGELDGKAR
ncbi:MAG: hypothetical protein EOP88_23810 [Verrucomicrobiaceae bacterium]|nr:MAG: hypothetical protein EOP88_23810 [Verrucomicrobiaceae bacterium]